MFFNYGYGLYFLFGLPALLLGIWAQMKVKSAFNQYSRVRTTIGLNGADVARRFLDAFGLQNVRVEQTNGLLSDHYDPQKKVLRLSRDVYNSPSIAAAGVAAHEASHALQDSQGYAPLKLRSAIVPGVQLGSWLGPIIFMVGLMLDSMSRNSGFGLQIAWFGLILFAATAVFALITLPVEYNASNRAKAWLSTSGVLYPQEMKGINAVLDAAALTYVAGAVQAISTVLYYLFLILGRRRD
jgi:Zn-dependent membrane protease YugP